MSDLVAAFDFSEVINGLFSLGLLFGGVFVIRRALRLLLGLINAPIEHNGGFVDFPRWGGRL